MTELGVRYATALFDLSMESGVPDEYFEQAVFLRDTLKDAECQRIIEHPDISRAEKHAFFDSAFDGKIHSDLLGFLNLIVQKNRESFLVPALTAFINLMNQYYKKTTAKVVSATALDESQISALKKMLSKKLEKDVDVSLKVDSSMIGGLYIHVDGYFIDRTIKKQLHDMQDSIKRSTPNEFQA